MCSRDFSKRIGIKYQKINTRSEASFRGAGGPSPPSPRKKKKRKKGRKKEKREKKEKKREKKEKKNKNKKGNYEWRQITTYKVLFFPIFQ